MKTENSQSDSSETEKYAGRLRLERARVEPHQGRFAASIGISQNRQSFLETGARELRADYLERIAGAGLDVGFIITGHRSAGSISEREAELLAVVAGFPKKHFDALLSYVRQLQSIFVDPGE